MRKAIFFIVCAVCLFILSSNSAIAEDVSIDAIIEVDDSVLLTEEVPYQKPKIPTINELKNMNISKPSGLTSEQLKRGLKGDLVQLAEVYIECEENGMNAVFQAAIDATESGWGKECFEPNNISGFYTDVKFKSKEDCIRFVSIRRSLWYLNEKHDSLYCDEQCDYFRNKFGECTIGQYHKDFTMSGMSVFYNPVGYGMANKDYSNYVIDIAYGIYSRALSEEEFVE